MIEVDMWFILGLALIVLLEHRIKMDVPGVSMDFFGFPLMLASSLSLSLQVHPIQKNIQAFMS